MQGWMDMTIQVKTFDPDALSANMELTGLPFGMLAGRQHIEQMRLRKPSAAYNGSGFTNLASCTADGRPSSLCADMKVYVGLTSISLATGDPLGYREINVDASTSNGLDYFPFDTYSITGVMQVGS
jgi:hypothetical protein